MENEIKACLERKVNYYETDMMGVVHHSNYIRWFEEARVMWMDKGGIPYEEVEKYGVQMPVLGVSCEYKVPAKFGDTICIETYTKEVTFVKYIIGYKITNKETGDLLCIGETKHCFVDNTFRPVNIKKHNPELTERLLALC
ncbi:MAG: acyl-CoA thioesterase [Oscillospiraceae bacterium]|nr:acyl-CoA thioesterase [Oscillospiraceae bacterium]